MEPRSPAPAEKSGANVPIEVKFDDRWRGLLWDNADHALLADGTWRVEKCEVAQSSQSTDLVPSFEIRITLDAVGGALLRRLTSTHLNRSLAIVVDGTIVAVPLLRTEFGEDFVISGNFSEATAEKLAAAIRKPDLRKRATFAFRFADAKSALADLKDEAASRKIRGFEATIDVRLNTVTITADADTLKVLQEILGRIDSADDPKPDASLNGTSILESFVHAGKPLLSPTPTESVVCKVQLSPNPVSNEPQIDSLLAVTLAGLDLTLPTMIELPNPDSARP